MGGLIIRWVDRWYEQGQRPWPSCWPAPDNRVDNNRVGGWVGGWIIRWVGIQDEVSCVMRQACSCPAHHWMCGMGGVVCVMRIG